MRTTVRRIRNMCAATVNPRSGVVWGEKGVPIRKGRVLFRGNFAASTLSHKKTVSSTIANREKIEREKCIPKKRHVVR